MTCLSTGMSFYPKLSIRLCREEGCSRTQSGGELVFNSPEVGSTTRFTNLSPSYCCSGDPKVLILSLESLLRVTLITRFTWSSYLISPSPKRKKRKAQTDETFPFFCNSRKYFFAIIHTFHCHNLSNPNYNYVFYNILIK